MKRILSMVVILSMTLSFRAFCAPINSFDASVATSDEMITLIVEVEETEVSSKGAVFSLFSDLDENTSAKDEVIAGICELLPESELPKYSYSEVFNGFSIDAPLSSVNEIKKLDNVKNVYISEKIPVPELMMSDAGEISGAYTAQETGYSGEGQVIAVIDGFLDCGHEMFKEVPQNPALSKEDITSVISETSLTIGNVNADEVYYSEKIPFVYNYPANNANVYSASSKHGTHVSAIAVGKNGKLTDGTLFSGVAPDAQLIFMNILYYDEEGNSFMESADILAAIDDSVKLGADVINLSLGVDFGNRNDSAEKVAIEAAKNTGVLVSCAAGNADRGNSYQELNTENIDYSTVASPSIYSDSFSVAAADTASKTQETSYVYSSSAWGVYDLNDLKPEITAPGVNIYSAVPGGYIKSKGTSMATPHISALYALLNQYHKTAPFSDEYNNLTGSEKVSFLENILMSSAFVMRAEDGIPYSPRHQGAGLADVVSATKAGVVISGTNGNAEVALGDNLDKSIEISFTIKNILDEEITFDDVKFEVTTDSYYSEGEIKKIRGTTALTICGNSFGDADITIPSGEEYEFSATITLDEDELLNNSLIFTNGFYIDGFVTFSDSTNNISSASVPFFGFYDDWDKAPVFDSTMYDEGGSKIVNASGVGTALAVSLGESGKFVLLGRNDYNKNVMDKKFIAFSNGSFSLIPSLPTLALGTFRRLKTADFVLTDNSGETVFSETLTADPKILLTYAAEITDEENFRKIPDGEYTLTVKGTLWGRNKNADDSFSLPFAIDSVTPKITSVKYDSVNNNIVVTAKDDRFLQSIYLYYTVDEENEYSVAFSTGTSAQKGDTYKVALPLGEDFPDFSEIRIGCTDYARNDIDICLKDALKTFLITDEIFMQGKTSASYEFMATNLSNKTTSVQFMSAMYDESGALVGICFDENKVTSLEKGKTAEVSFGLADCKNKICRVKVFAWKGLNNLNPTDVVYDFYLN